MSENRFIRVAYRMFTNSAASHKLLFETEVTRPIEFVTGMGLMIEAFEQRLAALPEGEQFDFTLSAADAFGERDEDLVHPVPRKVFEINGKFNEEEVFPGAEVPLMDKEGNQFYGTVVKVTDEEVTLDLNNPLAGKPLQFTGTVYTNHEATLKEIEQTANILSGGLDCSGCGGGSEGGGCCGGCGSCK